MDNPFVTPTAGQADWDASLNADLGVLERGYHVTERAGVAINTGQILWLNSGGFFFPFNPNSASIFPHAMAYTAAASGDSLTALAWGIVRSLGINSPSVAGFDLYVSALTPGLVVRSYAGENRKIGVGLKDYGVLFQPSRNNAPSAAGASTLAALTDVNTNGVANGKVLAWADASSKWVPATASGGGGFDVGTPPVPVQFAFNTNGTNGVTFATSPASGNLLLAIIFSPDADTAGTGWTKQAGENSSGTDYGFLTTKVLAAPGTLTQTPTAGLSGTGCMAVWEIHGQNASFYVAGLSQAEQAAATGNVPVYLPNLKDCLALAACGAAPGAISAVYNVASINVADAGGSRAVAAGYTDLSKTPLAGLLALFGGSLASKSFTALVKS